MIAGLPYDAEVEYLESTGAQWIDTGLKANETMAVQTKVAWMELGNDKVAFESDNGGTFVDGFGLQINFNGIRFIRGNKYKDTSIFPETDTFYDIFVGPAGIEVNNTLFAITDTSDFEPIGSLPLFAWRRSAKVFIYGKVKMGSTKIYYGSTLVRDFIPVRFTNSNGQSEGAMYDRVSRKLFRNAGTGSFTIGPDVATPVMGLHVFKSPAIAS